MALLKTPDLDEFCTISDEHSRERGAADLLMQSRSTLTKAVSRHGIGGRSRLVTAAYPQVLLLFSLICLTSLSSYPDHHPLSPLCHTRTFSPPLSLSLSLSLSSLRLGLALCELPIPYAQQITQPRRRWRQQRGRGPCLVYSRDQSNDCDRRGGQCPKLGSSRRGACESSGIHVLAHATPSLCINSLKYTRPHAHTHTRTHTHTYTHTR